ncbi:alpha/beta-hydrolase [Dendrothele bispora CBS 962.96]|uniref:Alpha/beta-hydrolase n=1 Tax=Dendrothele bispora (strain CBS 962.96) TaxID=1314807 RepID=A0A4S8LZ41_DENBC|nr:alpha/beta-hydrolase [Dendrothele bispora CBS 962.96]
MPSTKVKTSTGKTEFSYTISTPTKDSAKSIDNKLPTVLFLHAVYLSSSIFQYQFSDPRLRRFNLVSVDLRLHGQTAGDNPPAAYNECDAAEDIAKFMDAIKLPPSHIVGCSMGTMIATQLAMSYPKKCLSLFLMSPLGLTEPADIAEGREEITDYWMEGAKSNDEAALLDALYGARQFAFSNKTTTLITSLVNATYPLVKKNWVPKNFDAYRTVTVDFIAHRKEHSMEELAQIKVPVALAHGLDDIPYAPEVSEVYFKRLLDAGVDATLHKVTGAPHFICVDPGKEVNDLLHDFLLQNLREVAPPIPTKETLSPWDRDLRKNGWDPEDDDDVLHII